MAGKKRAKFFEAKIFGLVIGALIILLFLLLQNSFIVFDQLEISMLDNFFKNKTLSIDEATKVGAKQSSGLDLSINQDITIIGIDDRSINDLGRWPFPRYRHADLLSVFTTMRDRDKYRENAIFLDIFFSEPEAEGTSDAKVIREMHNNGRVFLESVLKENPFSDDDTNKEHFERQHVLYDSEWGEIKNVKGDWQHMKAYYGVEASLKPYVDAAYAYGHANFTEDHDEFYRRQEMIAKSSEVFAEFKFKYPIPANEDQSYLTIDTVVDEKKYQRLEWRDKYDKPNHIELPLTDSSLKKLYSEMKDKGVVKEIIETGNGEEGPKVVDSYYIVKLYQDHFIPAITLSLALNYFNKKLSDLDIEIGDYISIANPMVYKIKMKYDEELEQWYRPVRADKPEDIVLEPYEITLVKPIYATQEQVDNGEAKSTAQVMKEGKTEIIKEIKIPIDDDGKMLINFMGIPSFADPERYQTFTVRNYSWYALRPKNSRILQALNQILMVGPFSAGMAADQKTTPVGLMYGVEIHANALNTILMNKFIKQIPLWQDRLILFGLIMFIAFVSSRLKTILSMIITFVFTAAYFLVTTSIFDGKALLINYSLPAISMIFTFLTIVVYRVMTEERDKKRIRVMFGKYVSPGVVDHLLDNPPELGGVDKQLSVFFSDIRGFTTLSESMTPQELLNHLNVYFTKMTDIILAYNGTLDKYVGDEIMCFWGAPLPQEDHALLACKCALEQSAGLKELNAGWPEEKRINIGIGINSGIMTVGNVGSEGRMNYTLMGDPVNLGARLEGTNKQYGTQIIISEFTYGLVKDRVIVRELDNIRVKGKNKPVVIYELVDCT